MTEADRKLWGAVRRGLLLICAAIKEDPAASPLWRMVRRGFLLVCAAIERETTALSQEEVPS